MSQIDLGTHATEAGAREALRAETLRFLRAGGVVTWRDWTEMGEDVREAIHAANEEREEERSQMDAIARLAVHGEVAQSVQIGKALDSAAARVAESGLARVG